MQVIVYKESADSLSIITPTNEALSIYTIEEIAKKDVPYGVSFKILDVSSLVDCVVDNQWKSEVVFSPDGVGGDSHEGNLT